MPRFTSSIEVAADVERVWRRMVDWPAHGRWIPLTTVRVTSDQPGGVGARFVGRSALGPIGFDDPMEVVEWSPPGPGRPGHCRVQKHGRVVLGWAAFDVEAHPSGSRVVWTEDVQLAPVWLTFAAGRLIAAGGRLGFDRTLRAMARELESEGNTDG